MALLAKERRERGADLALRLTREWSREDFGVRAIGGRGHRAERLELDRVLAHAERPRDRGRWMERTARERGLEPQKESRPHLGRDGDGARTAGQCIARR